MSVENLKEYARRCASDPEVRDKARAIGGTDVEEHMRFAESLGIGWDSADMAAFRKELVDTDDSLADLDEEELDQIAGGALSVTAAVVVAAAVAVGVGVTATAAVAAGDGSL